MAHKSKLGIIIDRVRRAKQIKIKTLIADVGISQSAYSRILNGTTVPDVGTLLRLLNVLQLDLLEVKYLMPGVTDVPANVFLRASKAYGDMVITGDGTTLIESIANEKDKFETTGNRASELLYYDLAARYSRLQGEIELTEAYSAKAITLTNDYDEWNLFEIWIRSDVSANQKNDAILSVFDRFQRLTQNEIEELGLNSVHAFVLYRGLIDFAVNRESIAVMERTIALIRCRPLGEQDDFQMLALKLMDVIELLLNEETRTAKVMMKRLIGDFEWFAQSNIIIVDIFNRWFEKMQNNDWKKIIHVKHKQRG